MLDLLPDLTGKPDWVVIVVIALVVLGSVGVKWVGTRNRREDAEDDEGQEADRPGISSSGSDTQTTLALTRALDLLADEATESRGSRAEAERLRADLLACSRERDQFALNLEKAQADLEKCNRECRKLAMRVLEGDSGHE